MQFSFNRLLALSLAGFAIIFSTANPVITHKPIPVPFPTASSFLSPTPLTTTLGTSVNATSTSLIATTTTTSNPGIPLHPSTIQDQAPKTRLLPNGGGCEYPHLFFRPCRHEFPFIWYLLFPLEHNSKKINNNIWMWDDETCWTDSLILFFLFFYFRPFWTSWWQQSTKASQCGLPSSVVKTTWFGISLCVLLERCAPSPPLPSPPHVTPRQPASFAIHLSMPSSFTSLTHRTASSINSFRNLSAIHVRCPRVFFFFFWIWLGGCEDACTPLIERHERCKITHIFLPRRKLS